MAEQATRRWPFGRLVILGLVLLALVLRLAKLTFQPLWWDEGWSVYYAAGDLGSLLELTAVDIHPPLYYLALHLWLQFLGPGLVSSRLLSVLIGTATVPLLYIAGRRLFNQPVGLLAAALLALSPLHVYYSQEVRMYGLVTLCCLAALLLALRQPLSRGDWLGYVLAATAALYAEYFAALFLLALNVVVLIRWLRSVPQGHWPRPGRWREILPWLTAQVATGLLYLPWVWYVADKLPSYVRLKVAADQSVSLGLPAFLARHLTAFSWGYPEGELARWWWIGLLPLAAWLSCLLLALRPAARSAGLRLTAAVLTLVLAAGFCVNLVSPFNPPRSERALLLALPLFLLLFSGSLVGLGPGRRWLGVLPAGLLLAGNLLSLRYFYTTPRFPNDDYRPLVARLASLAQPGDAVLCVYPWQVGYLQAYIPDERQRPALVLTPRQVLPAERQLWADNPARLAAGLDALLADYRRLWLPYHQSLGLQMERLIEGYLAERAYPVLNEWANRNTRLSLVASGGADAPAAIQSALAPAVAQAQLGDAILLHNYAVLDDQLAPGDVLKVTLVWQAKSPITAAYKVFVQLLDRNGVLVAQRDSEPGDDLAPTIGWEPGRPQIDNHGILIPAETPPGSYQVITGLYPLTDPAARLLVVLDGRLAGDALPLGNITVTPP